MPERNGRWNGLSEAEQDKVLSLLRSNPSLVAKFADAAQSGDILAAEALIELVPVIIIQTDHPERTLIIPDKDKN